MKRREFVTLLGGAAVAWPFAARAQQKAMPIVGILNSNSRPVGPIPGGGAISRGLRETGFVEGQNVAIKYLHAESHYDRLPALAGELVQLKSDVIITIGGTAPALAAKNATSTIPIVFASVGDPVGIGLVSSLARPGGNLTGFSNIANELMPKLLDLLSKLAPLAQVIAMLVNPTNPNAEPLIRTMQEAARPTGIRLAVLTAGTEGEIDTAFASLAQQQAGGLVVEGDGFLATRREQLVTLASRGAVPAAYASRYFVDAGGLMSYGTDQTAILRQAGIYAGRILKGAKPADLPVEQPTKFELVINLKTATALGLTVPQVLLAQADEVIE
jgi:putative ABC transport system substrate-binding protein